MFSFFKTIYRFWSWSVNISWSNFFVFFILYFFFIFIHLLWIQLILFRCISQFFSFFCSSHCFDTFFFCFLKAEFMFCCDFYIISIHSSTPHIIHLLIIQYFYLKLLFFLGFPLFNNYYIFSLYFFPFNICSLIIIIIIIGMGYNMG